MAVSHVKSLTIGDFTGTVTAFNSQGSTTTVAATDLARPADWNSGHNQFYTLSGNTNNASTASGTNVVFMAAGGLTLAGSTGTIVISGPPHEMNFEQLLGTNVRPFAAQSSTSLGQNSLYVCPVILERPLSAICLKLPVLITNSSSAVSSGQKGQTIEVGAYSRVDTDPAGTGYTQLTRIWSGSHTMAASYSSNASFAHSAISAIGNSTSYNTYSSTSAGLNVSSILHGPRELIFAVSQSFPMGEYWMAIRNSTSGVGTVGNVMNISNVIATFQTYNRVGTATNASNEGLFRELIVGTYSATTGGLPATINKTQVRQAGTIVLGFAGQATA